MILHNDNWPLKRRLLTRRIQEAVKQILQEENALPLLPGTISEDGLIVSIGTSAI